MTQVKWRDFRANLADVIEQMRATNDRVQITRHGKVIAELVPPHGLTGRRAPCCDINASYPGQHRGGCPLQPASMIGG